MRRALSGRRYLEIAQGEFQAAVFGMIVVSDGEGDIERIARQQRRLLQALGHVPAQGVEGDLARKSSSQFSVLSSQLTARVAFGDGRGPFLAPDCGAVGMAARSRQDGGWRRVLGFTGLRGRVALARTRLTSASA